MCSSDLGAFVDIGVHQDGLVHVSALANKFVKDPHEVVKPGQIVKVKVLEVDVKRQRIALTMRLDDSAANRSQSRGGAQPVSAGAPRGRQDGRPGGMSSGGMRPGMGRPAGQESTGSSAMALAFEKLRKGR